jgi:hypothetical protein
LNLRSAVGATLPLVLIAGLCLLAAGLVLLAYLAFVPLRDFDAKIAEPMHGLFPGNHASRQCQPL